MHTILLSDVSSDLALSAFRDAKPADSKDAKAISGTATVAAVASGGDAKGSVSDAKAPADVKSDRDREFNSIAMHNKFDPRTIAHCCKLSSEWSSG